MKCTIFLRPVLQTAFTLPQRVIEKIHATRLAIDMPELQTRFTDRRGIHDWQKARRIGYARPIEKRLVVLKQVVRYM